MDIRELNNEEFVAEVIQSGQPSVIAFGTDTCGVCIVAKTIALPKWQDEHPKFKFYFVNVVNSPEAATLAGIKPPNVPQVLVMVGSQVLAESPGLPKEEDFLKMLASIDNIDKSLPSLSKRAVTVSNAMLKMIQARKLFVTHKVKQERLKKCRECVYLIRKTVAPATVTDPQAKVLADTCSACGCFVEAKTNLKTEKCPKGFWLEDK